RAFSDRRTAASDFFRAPVTFASPTLYKQSNLQHNWRWLDSRYGGGERRKSMRMWPLPAAAMMVVRRRPAWRRIARRRRRTHFCRAFAAFLALVATAYVSPLHAEDVAAFYRGKRINLIASYGTGGGYDVYARLLARFMSKYIPGSPNIIIQN